MPRFQNEVKNFSPCQLESFTETLTWMRQIFNSVSIHLLGKCCKFPNEHLLCSGSVSVAMICSPEVLV